MKAATSVSGTTLALWAPLPVMTIAANSTIAMLVRLKRFPAITLIAPGMRGAAPLKCIQRIDHFAVEHEPFRAAPLAFAKRALGRYSDFVDTRTPRRRFDFVDEVRHGVRKLSPRQRQFWIDDQQQKAVILDLALRQRRPREQSQRLHRKRQTVALVA